MIFLLFFVCVALHQLMELYGTLLPTAISASALAAAFAARYFKQGLGIELAYWGLAYSVMAVIVLGVALTQSHYGCMFLLGDCYQTRLPDWVSSIKTPLSLYMFSLNALALYRVLSLLVPSRLKSFLES